VGIEVHGLNLLAVASDRGAQFTRTVAIGRQGIHVEPHLLESHRRHRGLPELTDRQWFEPLLREWYGAEDVDSVDASPYEGATHIQDLNIPWSAAPEAIGRYDAVLDYGSLEHVFNFPTAWRSVVDLARVDGHILHALPCNNLAGHGFYQFSPELFFSLYRPERGFTLKGVWVALPAETRAWWQVADPRTVRRRVIFSNSHPAFLLVLAQKHAPVSVVAAPQQSDYETLDWVGQAAEAATPLRGRHPLARTLERWHLLDMVRRARERWRAARESGLVLPAPDFRRVDLATLTRRGAGAGSQTFDRK
jgi:hypothetical protein